MSDTERDRIEARWKRALKEWREGKISREELLKEWVWNKRHHHLGPIPSWYKKLLRQTHRAKANQALREGKEPPPEKKSSDYYW